MKSGELNINLEFVMTNPVTGKIPWYIALCLLFCKKHYATVTDNLEICYRVVFKYFNGKSYVLYGFQLPPFHPNCRCVIVATKKGVKSHV